MSCLHTVTAITLALVTSASAHAQSFEAPSTRPEVERTRDHAEPRPPSPSELPPGYEVPLPRTREDWELMRSTLQARVASAERRQEAVEEQGDETGKALVEEELRARKAALDDFEKETMGRKPGMAAGGLTLMGMGAVGLFLAADMAMLRSFNGPEGSDREKSGLVALGIAGAVVFTAGIPLFVVGIRKDWKGPPSDTTAAASLRVAPGRLLLAGSF